MALARQPAGIERFADPALGFAAARDAEVAQRLGQRVRTVILGLSEE